MTVNLTADGSKLRFTICSCAFSGYNKPATNSCFIPALKKLQIDLTCVVIM